MPAIKDASAIAKKWGTVTPQRSGEYKDGVTNPKKDWATEATKAETTYKQAVTAAANQGRYGGGVKKAGTATWQAGAQGKGPGRFAEGVMLGQTAYENGFAPFQGVIKATELPPRGAKGDPTNINRVSVMAKALNDKKVAMLK
jgi:hypothetical protein